MSCMRCFSKSHGHLLFVFCLAAAGCGGNSGPELSDGGNECRYSSDCVDDNNCTDDVCENGFCVHRTNEAPCSDGDACTVDDRCSGGICKGRPLDHDSDGFTPDYCGGRDCDDDDPQINPDAFEGPAGSPVCEDGRDNDCDGLIDVNDNTCGACNADSDCDDGNACTGKETCVDHHCERGIHLDCDDGNPCTDDSCDPLSGCAYSNNTGACDDGDECTIDDHCLGGECRGSLRDVDGDDYVDEECGGLDCDDSRAAVNPAAFEGPLGSPLCSDGLDNNCNGLTDDEDGTCLQCQSDGDCDDDNLCNGNEHCTEGLCLAGQPLDCQDDNPCTDDACDPQSGCLFSPNTAACDDGDPCTRDDRCNAGNCTGVPVDCDDDNPCTDDSCNENGYCDHLPNSASCDDGDPCTYDDRCSAGICSGTALDCDDDNPCTDDSCNENGYCDHVPDSAICDDGNPCTDDSCDPLSGCVNSNNSASCDDGDPLTYNDTCIDGECLGDPDACAQWAGLEGQELRDALFEALDGHSAIGYDQARYEMFSSLNNVDGSVQCVYTGQWLETWGIPDHEIMNTEHTWCQSWGSDTYPAKTDLNHIFPTMTVANSARSAHPFGWVMTPTWNMGGSSKGYNENYDIVFEPRDEHKGNAARAMFYFAVRYQMEIYYYQEEALRDFNDLDPPDSAEIMRNDLIEEIQGTRNPFVDCPALVELIEDF